MSTHINSTSAQQGNQQDFWPWQQENTNVVVERKQPSSPRGRRLLDMFGSSLKHVDALFNKQFGHAARKVPAHMPHMINKRIMKDLQAMFPAEFDKTSANKLRSRDDMQYSFSYFYFLIHQKVGRGSCWARRREGECARHRSHARLRLYFIGKHYGRGSLCRF